VSTPVPVDYNQLIRDLRPLIVAILGSFGLFLARLQYLKNNSRSEDYKVTQRELELDQKLERSRQELVNNLNRQITNLQNEIEKVKIERENYLNTSIRLQNALAATRAHKDFWRERYQDLIEKYKLNEPYPDISQLPENTLVNRKD
jgi:TolA-binding protein